MSAVGGCETSAVPSEIVPARHIRFAILVGLVAIGMPAAARAQEICTNPVALFESVQNSGPTPENSVQIVQAGASRTAGRQLRICAGDTIRVGDNSRAVILILASNTPFVIDQNTVLVIPPGPKECPSSFIYLLRGALLYISRVRRVTGVCTPFVNASIEGKEFLVRALGDHAEVTVFEGVVRAENQFGQVLVGAGQHAEAVQGKAPQIVVVAKPRDAVQWALYYEPILPADSFEALRAIPDRDH